MTDRINQSVPIVERPELAAELAAKVRDLRETGVRVFMMNGCHIILTEEPEGWHLSISRHDRDPTWSEIATARYRLLPEVSNMVMHLPALSDYVNLHPFTFHLYEEDRSMILRVA